MKLSLDDARFSQTFEAQEALHINFFNFFMPFPSLELELRTEETTEVRKSVL